MCELLDLGVKSVAHSELCEVWKQVALAKCVDGSTRGCVEMASQSVLITEAGLDNAIVAMESAGLSCCSGSVEELAEQV